jgi:hypothetical protein
MKQVPYNEKHYARYYESMSKYKGVAICKVHEGRKYTIVEKTHVACTIGFGNDIEKIIITRPTNDKDDQDLIHIYDIFLKCISKQQVEVFIKDKIHPLDMTFHSCFIIQKGIENVNMEASYTDMMYRIERQYVDKSCVVKSMLVEDICDFYDSYLHPLE